MFVGGLLPARAAARGRSNLSTAGTWHTGFRDRSVSAGANGVDDRRLLQRQWPKRYLSVRWNAHASNLSELGGTNWALMGNQ